MAQPQISRVAQRFGATAQQRASEAKRLIAQDLHSLQALIKRNAALAQAKALEVDVPRERVVGFAAVLILAVSAAGFAVSTTLSGSQTAAIEAAPAEDSLGSALAITNVSDGRDGRSFVLVGGVPLFPLPSGTMAAKADMPVEAQDAAVLSTVPGVGFWIGNNGNERVFVSPRPLTNPDAREVPLPELQVGQMVNLSGYVRALPDQAQDLGITDPADIAQLDAQGFRIEANSIRPQ